MTRFVKSLLLAIVAAGLTSEAAQAQPQRRLPRRNDLPAPVPDPGPGAKTAQVAPVPIGPALPTPTYAPGPFVPVEPIPYSGPPVAGPPTPYLTLPPQQFRTPGNFGPQNPRQPRTNVAGRIDAGPPQPFAADPNSNELYTPGIISEPPAELMAGSRGFPLQILLSEEFLNRLISRRDVQPGDIQDFIMGAQVTGQQVTETRLRMDLRPSREQARGEFVLDGQVDGMAVGQTEQARVNTAVQQQFHAVKEVLFDGERFSTRRAIISVRAHNQTLNAQTQLTGTVFGGLADSIAMRVAERRRPQAEAIARQKVADKVYPSFNGEVDNQLAIANEALSEKVGKLLESGSFLPEAQRLVTSETVLHWAVRFPGAPAPEVVAVPPAELISDRGFNMCVHESLLSQIGDRAGLSGLKTSDKQLKDVADRLMRLLPGSQVAEKVLTTPRGTVETDIEFDAKRPLMFEADNDQMVAIIRATFRPAGQSVLPPLVIRLPFWLQPEGDNYELMHGEVTVASENGTELSPFLATVTKNAIVASLPKVSFPKRIPKEGWKPDDTPPDLTAVNTKAGWLSFRLE